MIREWISFQTAAWIPSEIWLFCLLYSTFCRRQVFWISKQILQLMMEDAIDDWLLRQINWLRRDDIIAQGIRWVQDVRTEKLLSSFYSFSGTRLLLHLCTCVLRLSMLFSFSFSVFWWIFSLSVLSSCAACFGLIQATIPKKKKNYTYFLSI